jgi:hypothetical protein
VCGLSESDIERGEPEFTSERRERRKAARKHKRSYASADGYDLFAVHESACETALHAVSVRVGPQLAVQSPGDAQDQPEVSLSDHPHHAGLAKEDGDVYGAGEHASDVDDGPVADNAPVADDSQDQPDVGLIDHPQHASLSDDDGAVYGAGVHASDVNDGSVADDASVADEGAAAGAGAPEMRYSTTPRGTCKPTDDSMLGRMFWLDKRLTGRPCSSD